MVHSARDIGTGCRPSLEQLEPRLLLDAEIHGTVWQDLDVDGHRDGYVIDTDVPMDEKFCIPGPGAGTWHAGSGLDDYHQFDNVLVQGGGGLIEGIDLGNDPGTSVVSTTEDELDDDYSAGDLSLREALYLAYQSAGEDPITFDPALWGATITLSLGQLQVDSDMEIIGPGEDLLTIDANSASRVFSVNSGVTATISGLTVTGGLASGTDNDGGGIYNAGDLTLEAVVVTGNSTAGSYGHGGGLYNYYVGTVTITDSTFSYNITSSVSASSGGGLFNNNGAVTVTGSTFVGNEAESSGGGIYNSGPLTVLDCHFDGNTAGAGGGGLMLNSGSNPIQVVDIVDSVIENNIATTSGGGGFETNGPTVNVTNTWIMNNEAAVGGGVYNGNYSALTFTDSVIALNKAEHGGGIDANLGTVWILHSIVAGNEAETGDGGGIYCLAGTVNIQDSSVYYNTAYEAGGGIRGHHGAVSISNSTVSGNLALFSGGGISFSGDDPDELLTVRNSTVAKNVGLTTGGIDLEGTPAILHNTIVALNRQAGPMPSDVAGDFDPASSHNLIGAIDGSTGLDGTGALYGTVAAPLDPGLAPLGPPTELYCYHDVLPASQAIDAGSNAEALAADGSALTTDQRGLPRVFDGDENGSAIVDIGSIELVFSISEIHGIKWHDLDGDAQRDAEEPALAGWTIYLDLNANGQLDASEPTRTTDQDGQYAFTGLPKGSYVVGEVSQPGWDQTAPVAENQVFNAFVEAAEPRDLVFDSTRNLLYITTADGMVERFDMDTWTFLSPFVVGTSILNGADLTPDGAFLYVADHAPSDTEGFVQKVDLATGDVTTLAYALEFYEAGAWDVAVANNGKAFVTTRFAGSGWVPLRQIDLGTDILSIRGDAPGSGPSGEVRGKTFIARTPDGSVLFFGEPNISSCPVFTYDAASDTFGASAELNTYGDDAVSVSHDGSLMAFETSSGIRVLDATLSPVQTLTGLEGGFAFSPVADVLYGVDVDADELVALDTTSWVELFRVPVGEDALPSDEFDCGVTTVSADGRRLFLSTPGGVRVFTFVAAGSHVVTVGLGEIAEDIDFGNRSLPPEVTSGLVNRGAQQRSRIMELAFSFSEDVSASIDAGDLTMTRYDEGATDWLAVDLAGATVSYDGGSETATWDLSAVTLANGYHRATLTAAGITDAAGNPLDGDGDGTGGDDYVYPFHRLAGDCNGDAMAQIADLGMLGAHWKQTGNWWELPGDLNADGMVQVSDLGILGANYGTTLTPPPAGGFDSGTAAAGSEGPRGLGASQQPDGKGHVQAAPIAPREPRTRPVPGNSQAPVRGILPPATYDASAAQGHTTILPVRTAGLADGAADLVDLLGLRPRDLLSAR